jgi:ubiquinone/menaquinone biosynthesis C-methylase UbiE
MNKTADSFWNLTANGYDKIESRLEHIYTKIYSNLKRHVRQDDIVLDFACGTGTSSIQIADKVKKIDAIDISSKMLEIAKTKAEKNNFEKY